MNKCLGLVRVPVDDLWNADQQHRCTYILTSPNNDKGSGGQRLEFHLFTFALESKKISKVKHPNPYFLADMKHEQISDTLCVKSNFNPYT